MRWTYRFVIRRPGKTSRSFDIVCDKKNPEAREQKSIKKLKDFTAEAKALEAVNDSLDGKAATLIKAEKEVEIIVKGLYEKVRTLSDAITDAIVNDANMTVFNSYWLSKYVNRKVKDKDRTYNAYLYALRTFEPLSLAGSDAVQIQKHWDKALTGTAHRRYGQCINSLLTYLKRDFTIQLEPLDQPEVRFIPFADFKTFIPTVEPRPLKLLICTLYATGCRTGEAFALTSQSFKGDIAVFISRQVDRKGIRRKPKNSVEHDALIIQDFLKELKEWTALDPDIKKDLRKSCAKDIPEVFRKAGWNITAHDLRHSYANQLLAMGIPLDRVAQCLGDSIEVCEKHYRGWVIDDVNLRALSAILNSKSP